MEYPSGSIVIGPRGHNVYLFWEMMDREKQRCTLHWIGVAACHWGVARDRGLV